MSRPSPVDPARFHLAAIVESSDDAIVSKDLDGIIQSWNTGAERLFGYRAAEVIGRSISILVPADRPDEEPGILARIRRGERVEHYETVRVRKDGGSIDVSITVSPIRDESGRIIGA
jgi:PAS domain S-box-containing protein